MLLMFVVLPYILIHTDYHASADITELRFLAVVVLELVGFVVDPDNRLHRLWILLLHLNLLLIYEVDLDTQRSYISYLIIQYTGNVFMLPGR